MEFANLRPIPAIASAAMAAIAITTLLVTACGRTDATDFANHTAATVNVGRAPTIGAIDEIFGADGQPATDFSDGDYVQVRRPDDIRPIYNPDFVSAANADRSDDELVIGLSINGETRAYPAGILYIRELVNDEVGGCTSGRQLVSALLHRDGTRPPYWRHDDRLRQSGGPLQRRNDLVRPRHRHYLVPTPGQSHRRATSWRQPRPYPGPIHNLEAVAKSISAFARSFCQPTDFALQGAALRHKARSWRGYRGCRGGVASQQILRRRNRYRIGRRLCYRRFS